MKVIPNGYKPVFEETRSRRTVCLFTPSLYSKLKEYADKNKRSVNDVIVEIIHSFFSDK